MIVISFTPRERGQYGISRAKDQLFDAVCELWRQRKDEGLTIDELAARIGRSPRWVKRALSGPGHWNIKIFGQLTEALEGETTICLLPDKVPLVEVLSDRLHNKVRLISSIQTMTEMPEFQKLIELGDDTVRYILNQFWWREVRTFYFPLLKRITGEDPVPVYERGRVPHMRDRWIAWGQDHGYLAIEKSSCNQETSTV